MRIRIARPWINPDTGKLLSKGAVVDCTRERGKWLIKRGYGVEQSEEVQQVKQSSKDELVKEQPEVVEFVKPKTKYKRPKPKKTDPNK